MKLNAFPHLAWAITREALRSLESRAEGMEQLIARGVGLPEPSAELSPAEKSRAVYNGGNPIAPEIVDGVATIEIMGDLIARAPWWAKIYLGAIDPFDVADAVDALTADATVTSLVIEMDCCGGTISGTAEAAAAITRFQTAGKTVEVRAAGVIASAAYWMVAGADRIVATATTHVGCLGVLMVLCDDTAAQSAAGVRFEVVASAPGKGLGSDGAVTPALRSQAQKMVGDLVGVFRDAVAAGRGLTGAALDGAFTGECWLGAEALTMGLIDAVSSPADELDKATGDKPAPDPVPPALDTDAEPSPSASAHPTTTPAAAGNKESNTMDKQLQAALAALTTAHPTHAVALVAHATKDGTTADGLRAFASDLVATATAAELTDAKAKLAAAEAKAKTDSDALAKANADLAKLKGHQQTEDPGQGDPASASMSGEQFLKLDPQARGAFRAKGGQVK